MADTTVTTGKTIDNLDTVAQAYPDDAEKQAYFKANGIIPVRSKGASGESKDDMKTCQVPLSELVPDAGVDISEGNNHAKTLSVPGTGGLGITVNNAGSGSIFILTGDSTKVDTRTGRLEVTNPVPGDGQDGQILGYDSNAGGMVWKSPEEQVQADWNELDDSKPSFIANKPFIGIDGSGGLETFEGNIVVEVDRETIRRRDGGALYVANPVPEPAANHADAGKVLTVKTVNNSDEIVWDAPQGGGGIDLPKGEASWDHLDSGGGLYIPLLAYYEWNGTHAGQSVTRIVLDDDDSNWKKPL